jgi:Zn-finger nucleic acid-binding protein
MNCVRCQIKMKKAERDGVLIDVCPECKGIWLDGGELAMLRAGEGMEKEEILADARAEILKERAEIASVVGMCPKCQTAYLDAVRHAGVEVDICPSCKGMFFDDGELEIARQRENKTTFKQTLVAVLFFRR